jgi:site-specific recombinase XerD
MNRFHRFDVLTEWYREHLTIGEYRPRTIADYLFELSFFRRHLSETTGIQDVDELTPALIHDYAAHLYQRELAAATIHHKLSVLNSFFGAAYEHNKLYLDLRKTVQRPRIGRKIPAGILTEQETKRVFEYIERTAARTDIVTLQDAAELRDCAMVDLLYSSGMRRNELTALTLDDINSADGLVYIRQGKGGKDRVVPLGNATAATLQAYREKARPILCGRLSCDYLFVTRHAARVGEYTIRQSVIRVTRTAGIGRHVRVHHLRHSCATHLLNNGADIRYVQELLGHQSLSSTQVYTHVSIGKLKDTHRKHHPREREGF